MRLKKIVSGILACAMVVTSVFVGDVSTVKAEAEVPQPSSNYNFNDGLGTNVTALAKGLEAYDKATNTNETGRSGASGDKAVKLGDYGLKLPDANIGSNYTVSMWVKPDGKIAGNSPVFALGVGIVGGDENWVALAGDDGAQTCKLWSKNNVNKDGFNTAHTTLGSLTLLSERWSMLTVTQSGNDITCYLNGEVAASGKAEEILNGSDGAVYLGVNAWDTVFKGWMDDVSVYSTALTADQVELLYFKEDVFTVAKTRTMYTRNQKKINTSKVNSKVTFTYNSDDTSVATVSADGTVTGVKAGTATVTTTAVMGSETKTGTTEITVKDAPNGASSGVVAEYRFARAENGVVKDLSGHGNDAAIVIDQGKASGITFTAVSAEDPESAGTMTVTGDDSYLTLPIGIMDSLTDPEAFTIETTFAKSKDCGNNAWLFCLGSISKAAGTNYLFFCPNFWGKTLRAGIKDSYDEAVFETSTEPEIGKEYTVNMVFNHGTVKLYWNGVLINGNNGTELNTDYSIMGDIVDPGTTDDILGFIGKSCWSGDKKYQGTISSFKVYNKAQTDEDVQLSKSEYKDELQKILDEGLKTEDIIGDNASENEIINNLKLPSALGEIALQWESKTPTIISDNGVVTNPKDKDTEVIMTATLTSGALTVTKDFTLKVKKLEDSELQVLLTKAQELLDGVEEADSSVKELLDVESLKRAMDEANAVTTQSKVKIAERKLRKAIDNFYPVVWTDPFASIDDSKDGQTVEMAPGTKDTFLDIPEQIKALVTVKRTSSNPEIAAIDQETGEVTAVKAGYSKITTTVTAKSDTFAMEYQTLVKVDLDMSGITAKAESDTIAVSKKTKVTLTLPQEVKDANPEITYQADNGGIVSVTKDEETENAEVTGLAAGDGVVTVTVRAAGKIKAIPVQVKVTDGSEKPPAGKVDLSGVTAAADSASIAQGSTTKITITYPAEVQAANPSATYTASGAVSVDKVGTVTGNSVGEGIVTVVVTAGEDSITLPPIKITVTKKSSDGPGNAGEGNKPGEEDTTVDLSKVAVKAAATKIAKGKTTTISISYPNDATKNAAKVSYKVSKDKRLSVKNGKVTGKKAGKGTVTVTIKAAGQTITKKVIISVGEITGKSSVKANKSITLKVKGISGKVKWSVNKKKLATISKKGKLKAKKAGKVKVTAKVGKVTMTKTIKIKK